MADQLGRFGMAIAVISLIATGLYQFSGRVSVAEPGNSRIVFKSPN